MPKQDFTIRAHSDWHHPVFSLTSGFPLTLACGISKTNDNELIPRSKQSSDYRLSRRLGQIMGGGGPFHSGPKRREYTMPRSFMQSQGSTIRMCLRQALAYGQRGLFTNGAKAGRMGL